MSFGGLLTPYFLTNVGNPNIKNPGARALANILDLSGGSTFYTMRGAGATSATSAGRTLKQIAIGAKKPVEPVTPDPNAAAKSAQEAQNKRRRTILSSGGQTDITGGGAGIGQTGLKTLLGA